MTILVVGSLHLDVVVQAPHLPRLDETVSGKAVDYVFGGKGGNQALAVARLGGAVSIAGRAGKDAFGDIIRDTLKASGADISLLQQDDAASGMSVAIIDENGDYGAVIVSEANLRIEAGLVAIPQGTKLVLLQNEIPEAVNLSIANAAKASGATVWLNAAPARPLSDKLLSQIDLLIVNKVEADFYRQLPETLAVLTTLGAQGVLYHGRLWPAETVQVLSTHGAGDMFVGALATRAARGHSIEIAIPFAQAAAAWHISTDPSVRNGMRPEDLVAKLNAQLKP